jgi:hypothetical protein
MWPKREKQRYLCFIADSANSSARVNIKVITDFVVNEARELDQFDTLSPLLDSK